MSQLRILSLNCWGGRSMYQLTRFLMAQRERTDVFCLQEVFDGRDQAVLDERHPDEYLYANMFDVIGQVLIEFIGVFAVHPGDPHRMSVATFIRKGVGISRTEIAEIHTPTKEQAHGSYVISSRKMLMTSLRLGGSSVTVANYHGLWSGGDKRDSPERTAQSERIKDILAKRRGSKVLIGDMNLDPDTMAISIMGQGMIDLVGRSGWITGTRTPLYRFHGREGVSQFADYAFMTPGLSLISFETLSNYASDHAALRLHVATPRT